MPDEFTCDVCGKGPFKAKVGLIGHQRSHLPKAPKGEGVSNGATSAHVSVSSPPSSGPAIIDSWKRATKLLVSSRQITVADPRCKICQSGDNVPLDWYRECPHDPYVTMTPVFEPPRYEDVLDETGRPTGRKRKLPQDILSFIPTPNTREVTDSMRSNSGWGPEWGRRKGFIPLSEVRSPHFPNGIAETCQFRSCRWQDGKVDPRTEEVTHLKRYKNGVFCREVEAQLVWHDDTGTTLEVGEWTNEAQQNRMKMLAAADV